MFKIIVGIIVIATSGYVLTSSHPFEAQMAMIGCMIFLGIILCVGIAEFAKVAKAGSLMRQS